MLDLTGVHNSADCNRANGQPCEACLWANSVDQYPADFEDGLIDSELYRALDGYKERFGEPALATAVDEYLGRC